MKSNTRKQDVVHVGGDSIKRFDIEIHDDRFTYFTGSEFDAYKSAYAFRENKTRVEFAKGVGRWMVTVYNTPNLISAFRFLDDDEIKNIAGDKKLAKNIKRMLKDSSEEGSDLNRKDIPFDGWKEYEWGFRYFASNHEDAESFVEFFTGLNSEINKSDFNRWEVNVYKEGYFLEADEVKKIVGDEKVTMDAVKLIKNAHPHFALRQALWAYHRGFPERKKT